MKTKIIGFLICMLLIFTIGLPVSSTSMMDRTIKSLSNGETLYVGGSGPENYSSIQEAIDDAVDGNTVYVYDDSSPYFENLIVEKSIYLIGENRDTTVIDGNGNYNVVNVIANSVTISGFTIQKSGNEWGEAGIDIHFSNYNTIVNNQISNNENGILLDNSSCNNFISGNNIILNNDSGIRIFDSSGDNFISGNNFSFNNGIRLWHSGKNNSMIGNTFSYNNYSISLAHSGNNDIITGNAFTNSNVSIDLYYSNNNTITDNIIITNNTWGIFLHSLCDNNTISGNTIYSNKYNKLDVDYSIFNTITVNSIINKNNWLIFQQDLYKNKDYGSKDIIPNNLFGISIGYLCNNNYISDNTISDNYCGILLALSSNNNHILRNTISNAYSGLVLAFSYYNVIKSNNFIDNIDQATFTYRIIDDYKTNSWEENYWNRPRILPKLIIGIMMICIIPIPWLQLDWNPAREPYDI